MPQQTLHPRQGERGLRLALLPREELRPRRLRGLRARRGAGPHAGREVQARPERVLRDLLPRAPPAERAPGRGILHLFKAAVWTFHTNFGRRLGHRGAGGAIA